MTPFLLAVLLIDPFGIAEPLPDAFGAAPAVESHRFAAKPVVDHKTPIVSDKPAPDIAPAISAPLVITVTDHCPHGDAAEREIVPHLAKAGWRAGKHYQVVRSADGPCPQFAWRGEQFSADGWPGWDEWSARLHRAMGRASDRKAPSSPAGGGSPGVTTFPPPAVSYSLPPVPSVFPPPPAGRVSYDNPWGVPLAPGETVVVFDGRPVSQAVPSYATQLAPAAPRTMVAGSTWDDLARHLAMHHGVNPAGMSPAQMEAAHTAAHSGGRSQPVRRYASRRSCAGGYCP